ncbi:MAG TPA: phage tail sheath subtilisin-like domain-containing protein [Bradyrhizobium sp.]|jgi:hypothetical protein|nr:phage tail sheath subtilisin-like domain-containing protein [Bradyrhizobium sp.]
MPEYLSPGVYVEEIDAGPKPIEGVSTSTCGAVGVTARGPTSGKPVLVTSFADFVRTFGGFLPAPEKAIYNNWALDSTNGGRWWLFPLAVKGFFDNGGQRLYVKRVFAATATAASADLGKGLVSEILSDAAPGAKDLQLRHVIGIPVNATIKIFSGDTNNAQNGANYTVTAVNAASGKIRITPGLTAAAQAKRGDFVEINARSASPVPAPEKTLQVRAKARGVWGRDLSARVRPVIGGTFKLLRDPALSASINVGTVVSVAVAGVPPVTTVAVDNLGDLKDHDKIIVMGRPYAVSNIVTATKKFDITPDVPQGENWVGAAVARVRNESTKVVAVAANTIQVDDIRDLANNAHISVNDREYAISSVVAATQKFDITPGIPAGENWIPGTLIKRFGAANDSGNPADTIRAWGASRLYKGALVEFDNGTDKESFTVNGTSGDTVTLSGNLTKAYYESHVLRIIEAEVNVRYTPKNNDPADETFSNLRLIDDQSLSYVVNNVNKLSKLVELQAKDGFGNSLATFPTAAGGGWQALDSGGDDKLVDLSVDDFVGVDGGSGNRTGIQALEDIEDIAIALVPGIWAGTVQSALIQHCEQLRYRFAILDPTDGLTIEGIQAFRSVIDTKYAALYYPWLEVRDPSAKLTVIAPPSGHMAGIYARVDVERGVHKAPANEVIRGIEKIAQDVNKREQDVLNPKNIDVLRFFPGRGYRVWGARVVTSDAAWKYINVRRLFIFVEHSIDYGTQWVVFEPNDEPLWARVRQTIENFLTTVWRSGALQGGKASEAFFVKCDRSTMTQDDIDNGRLICQIGIAPVKPAEFVIFRIQQKMLDQTTA